MVGPGRPNFVVFGSSMVQMSCNVGGWASIFADLYTRRADVVLRGYAGWNTRMALKVLDQVFPKVFVSVSSYKRKGHFCPDAAVQPCLVIVNFGGDDAANPHPSGLGSHVPLPEYIDNMRKIILHLKSLSDTIRIICLSSPPVNEAKVREIFGNTFDDQAWTNESCRIYAESLVELCLEMDVEAINLWTAIRGKDDWANAYFTDGIHLSADGSKVVVEEMLKTLKNVNWEPSLYWLSIRPEFREDSPYYPVNLDGKTTYNISGNIPPWQRQWLNI